MNIGIVGAGKVGVSLGRFLSDSKINVVGFYDITQKNAAQAAAFTNTDSFSSVEKLVALSDTLFITTPDGAIAAAWDCIKEMSVQNKIICHFSGALSSDVFSQADKAKAFVCSVHPIMAFIDKLTSYRSLKNAFFTAEGDEKAVLAIENLFTSLGGTVYRIDKSKKTLYHTAASLLSNSVVALLDLGYSLFSQCGFSRQEATAATRNLVLGNVQSVVQNDCISALTGPVERGDTKTVREHIESLKGSDKYLYILLSQRLLDLAKQKNAGRNYGGLEAFLNSELAKCELTEG